MRLRLLSWNLHACIGTDGRLDVARIAALICALKPDVAALQELDAYKERTGWINQWRSLGRATGLSAFYGANLMAVADAPPPNAPAGHPGRWVGQYGVAVLTGLRVRAVENHLLTYRAEGPGYKEQRGCLEVETDVATFLCTHWGLHQEERLGQCRDILALADAALQVGNPAVVLGDLNAVSIAPEIVPLRERFRDAGAGAGPTIPADGPRQRIDYCFVPRAWRVMEAQVLPTDASDHCGLLVDVETEG